jgi:hypothetical protein
LSVLLIEAGLLHLLSSDLSPQPAPISDPPPRPV